MGDILNGCPFNTEEIKLLLPCVSKWKMYRVTGKPPFLQCCQKYIPGIEKMCKK